MPPPSEKPNDPAPDAPPFFTRYGFSRPPEGEDHLLIEPYPEICRGGGLKRTILISAVDLVASMLIREVAGIDATFTSDLSLRAPARFIPRTLLARGEVLRAGGRLVTVGVRLESEAGLFAVGESTFSRMPRPADSSLRLEDLRLPRVIESHPLPAPLDEVVGIETDATHRGRVRLELRPALLNPEGILQGALIGLLIESAAESLAPPRAIIEEIDIRYLAAGKVGPIEAEASWLDFAGSVDDPPSPQHWMRVELRDLGQAGRRTATAFVRTRT